MATNNSIEEKFDRTDMNVLVASGWAHKFNPDTKQWISKALAPPVKGIVKKPHGEKPQIHAVEQIEKVYKDTYDMRLLTAVKDITKYLLG